MGCPRVFAHQAQRHRGFSQRGQDVCRAFAQRCDFAGSLKPSDIAPSGLHKSKTPGSLIPPPFWVRPPRGPNPTIRPAGEPAALFHTVTLVGFVGADPEQRQTRNNGAKFTVLSVATQRSWKTDDDGWSSKTEWHRISIFHPRLAEHVLTAIKKGAHVLVEGSLVSSVYLPANGKSKKNKPTKVTSWTIRADAVRRLDRGEPEPQAPASGTSEHSFESSEGETF
jgi:single stranded DNA-binding protein